MRFILILGVSLLTAACGTKYKNLGLMGGVAAERISDDTYRISARGNSHTSRGTIKNYIMLKAAETTKRAGGRHFIFISASEVSQGAYVANTGRAQRSFAGNTAYTTYTPGAVQSLFQPGQDAYIKVLRTAEGSQLPPGAMSAEDIIKFLRPRVTRD